MIIVGETEKPFRIAAFTVRTAVFDPLRVPVIVAFVL